MSDPSRTTNTVDLKPCPFCSAQPLVNVIEAHTHSPLLKQMGVPDHPGSVVIECGCGAGLIDDTLEAVAARWNLRMDRLAPEPGVQLDFMERTALMAWHDSRAADCLSQGYGSGEQRHRLRSAQLADAFRVSPAISQAVPKTEWEDLLEAAKHLARSVEQVGHSDYGPACHICQAIATVNRLAETKAGSGT